MLINLLVRDSARGPNKYLCYEPLQKMRVRLGPRKTGLNYGTLYFACNDRKAFFTSSDQSRYTLWSCQNVCDALSYLLDNI